MLRKIALLVLFAGLAAGCSSAVSPDNEPANLLRNPDQAPLSEADIDLNAMQLALVDDSGEETRINAEPGVAVAAKRAHVTSPPSKYSTYVTALHITGLHESCYSVGIDVFCHITSGPHKSEYQNIHN